MNKQEKNIEELFELIKNLHIIADEYERSGLKPIDLINSTDAHQELDFLDAMNTSKYDFSSMSWGEACNFILSYSEFYGERLKKFRASPQSKLLH